MKRHYKVYTDGSALGRTPNYIGGWAVVANYSNTEELNSLDELSGSKYPTTNNEMELMAILKAIEFCIARKNEDALFTIYSDSAYALNSITKWLQGWKRNGWINSKKQPVKNREVFEQIDTLLNFCPVLINFEKVKGHTGDYFNERADDLAVAESTSLKAQLIEEGKINE